MTVSKHEKHAELVVDSLSNVYNKQLFAANKHSFPVF